MTSDQHRLHRTAADWLIRLREEPDDRDTADAFEIWLDEMPEHVRAWASVSAMFEAIGETRPELTEAWQGQQTTPSANHQQQQRKPRRWAHIARRIPSRYIPNARQAGTALVAALALILVTPPALLYAHADHITSTSEVKLVTLDDGSTVRLGPKTAISVDYKTGVRTVRLLAGQAWFDVSHNPAAPFRVLAGDVRTTVLGTSFDVRRIGASTSVSVARGRVQVADLHGTPAPAHILSAGNWASIDASHRMTHGTDNPALLGAWRDGQLIVRNRPVSEVIDELRPWYNGRIIILKSALNSRRIDGVFNARSTLPAIKAVVGQEDVTVRTVTPWLIIIS